MSIDAGNALVLPELPAGPRAVPLYRVTGTRSLARRNEDVRRQLHERVERWRTIFPVDAEPADLGDRMLFLTEDSALEVFVPSESVWWTDRRSAYAEKPPDRDLPTPERAAELARKYLETIGVADDPLRLRDVGTTEAASVSSPEESPEPVTTGVTVSFGYHLDEIPVVGPGARVRVGYGGGEEPVELARFWRTPEPVDELTVLHPMRAVERLAADRRFAKVLGAGGRLVVEEITFAFYAAGPGAFQRYLVPVYHARGQVSGSEIEEDVFDLFVTAVDVTEQDLKERMPRDRPVLRRVFPGF